MNVFDLYASITLNSEEYERELGEASKKTSSFSSKMKTGLATAGKIAAAGLAAAGTAAVALGKSALDSYAGYEQLVGGVDTLFKESSKKVQEYAANAYNTAGMSANQYMETVTSFSASLLQSLAGDTDMAADYADRAIVSMADNANKMGTSIEMIQNAYQGFAKQNYTMLDNLKLGYGGTKQEMERLISDAAAMTDVQRELGITVDESSMSFANIVNAIEVMQSSLGIAGATAAEASSTIEGSLSAAKSAWANLVVGIADENAKLGDLVTKFFDSVGVAADNILPRIGIIVKRVGELVIESAPEVLKSGAELLGNIATGFVEGIPVFLEKIPEFIESFLNFMTEQGPVILQKGSDLLEQLAFGLIEGIPKLLEKLPDIIRGIAEFFAETAPKIVRIGAELIGNLIVGIFGMIPELILQLPEVLKAIIDAFEAGKESMKEAGKNLLMGLWNGIADKISWLKGKVTGVVDTIKGWFTGPSGFDEHSPSKWSNGVFRYVMEGGAQGLEAGLPSLMSDVKSVTDTVKSGMEMEPTSVEFPASSSGGSGGRSSGRTEEVTIPITTEIDGTVLARKMYKLILREGDLRGGTLVEVT